MKYEFAVIGLGKVGHAMLALLSESGHTPRWAVSSKNPATACPVYPDIPAGPEGAKVIFIAVPDKVIEETALRIGSLWGDACRSLVFFHFSGLLSSDILRELAQRGAETGSLHPLQSVMDVDLARESIQKAYFVFEGTVEAGRAAQDLVESLSSRMISIKASDKVIYHAAAAIASNFLVAVSGQAQVLMESIGLELKHLIPLIRSTVDNLEVHGMKALTGPIQRGDWETVKAHCEAIEKAFPDILPSYLSLARFTAGIASRSRPAGLCSREKLVKRDALAERVRLMKDRGMKVVFTNGCFDILHEGHVSYLAEARALGDALVLGLNSDASVRKLKGEERPVNSELSRAGVLSGLSSIDSICLFEEDTPYELIAALCPDVLVKGGDWAPEMIVGADIVQSYGGEVRSLAFREGRSTTGLIDKIRSL